MMATKRRGNEGDAWMFVAQVEDVGFLKDKPKALHAFRVVTKGHIYLLSAKSAALKKDWTKASSSSSGSENLYECGCQA